MWIWVPRLTIRRMLVLIAIIAVLISQVRLRSKFGTYSADYYVEIWGLQVGYSASGDGVGYQTTMSCYARLHSTGKHWWTPSSRIYVNGVEKQ